MGKQVFLVVPQSHTNAVPYQAQEAKNWLNQELAKLLKGHVVLKWPNGNDPELVMAIHVSAVEELKRRLEQ